MRFLRFEAKGGHWGEDGWKQVSFRKWIGLWLTEHVVRVRLQYKHSRQHERSTK